MSVRRELANPERGPVRHSAVAQGSTRLQTAAHARTLPDALAEFLRRSDRLFHRPAVRPSGDLSPPMLLHSSL